MYRLSFRLPGGSRARSDRTGTYIQGYKKTNKLLTKPDDDQRNMTLATADTYWRYYARSVEFPGNLAHKRRSELWQARCTSLQRRRRAPWKVPALSAWANHNAWYKKYFGICVAPDTGARGVWGSYHFLLQAYHRLLMTSPFRSRKPPLMNLFFKNSLSLSKNPPRSLPNRSSKSLSPLWLWRPLLP